MPLSWDSLQDAPTNHYLLHGDGNCSKVKLFSCQSWLLKLLQPEGNPPSCQAQLHEALFHASSQLCSHDEL